jgi:DNA helicase-2/ATP-dependent DNA helicase PcrA
MEIQMTANLSPQQLAILDWVAQGSGSALVRARAGTGKTFTCLEAMPFMSGSIAYVVFNNKNAAEAKEKVAARGLTGKVTVGTFHSFGWKAWGRANRNVELNKERNHKGKIGLLCEQLNIPAEFQGFVRKAVPLAKLRGFGIKDRVINTPQPWLDLVSHYDLDLDLAEIEYFDPVQEDYLTDEEVLRTALRFACKVLAASIKQAPEVSDFDDMIYMPLFSGCRMDTYDWVIVDEAQDSNPTRRAMAKRLLKPGGRAIFVGDDWQAIYGFTGADNDSLDIIAREWNTREFPLTITYRCPKAVVREANLIVADYVAADSAPEGSHTSMKLEEMLKLNSLGQGDAMICRNTAPLVDVAFSLIKRGITCHVEGREIGRGLIQLATRWTNVKTFSALRDKLEALQEKEVNKYMAAGQEDKAQGLVDRIETLYAIMATVTSDRVADLVAKIDGMFRDTPEGKRAPGVVLMTAHRSKGLEFPRVFLLGRNIYMPSPYARQDWQQHQEKCLEYVALTRAQETLVDVICPPPPPKK